MHKECLWADCVEVYHLNFSSSTVDVQEKFDISGIVADFFAKFTAFIEED